MQEWMYSFHSLKFGSTQAGGHLHTLATLPFGKEPRVPPGQAPELVQKLQRKKNILYCCQEITPIPHLSNPQHSYYKKPANPSTCHG